MAEDNAPLPKYLDEAGRIIAPSIERPGDLTPVSVRLPSLDEMSKLAPDELLQVAQKYGVYEPWRNLFAQNAEYVAKFSRLTPGTPAFDAEVMRITEPMSSPRAALGLARAANRNYNQILATDGDESQILVRVGEGDDAMCEGCQVAEGAEGTLAEHDAIGLPGTQQCGQNCRCVLIPVESPPAREEAEGDIVGDIIGGILIGAAASYVIDKLLED